MICKPWQAIIWGDGGVCDHVGEHFIGKDIRPVEAMCWADTLVHNIPAEDHAIALVKFQNGSIGQIEVSWAFRGGMDLRDEVAGTEGTIWLDHFACQSI